MSVGRYLLRFLSWLLIGGVRVYQSCLRPFLPPSCRFRTVVQRVLHSSGQQIRCGEGSLARHEADLPVPPLERRRV